MIKKQLQDRLQHVEMVIDDNHPLLKEYLPLVMMLKNFLSFDIGGDTLTKAEVRLQTLETMVNDRVQHREVYERALFVTMYLPQLSSMFASDTKPIEPAEVLKIIRMIDRIIERLTPVDPKEVDTDVLCRLYLTSLQQSEFRRMLHIADIVISEARNHDRDVDEVLTSVNTHLENSVQRMTDHVDVIDLRRYL